MVKEIMDVDAPLRLRGFKLDPPCLRLFVRLKKGFDTLLARTFFPLEILGGSRRC
jgi:hypothetical protein